MAQIPLWVDKDIAVLAKKLNQSVNKDNVQTWRMQTDKTITFQAMKVEYIIKDILDSRLKNVQYDADRCNFITKQLCKDIREKTKQFQYDRCRLITQVLVGQDSDQSVQVASRCLWNTATDNFAAATFRNSSIYAVAVVYGVYLD